MPDDLETRAGGDATLADTSHPAKLIVVDNFGTIGSDLGVKTPRPTQVRPLPVIAGYEILSELGRGGMGVVYLGRQLLLNRKCALKMILAGDHASPEIALRFLAEAEAVAQIRHPNVVQIYHIGETDGVPYFELEYCPGGSLDRSLDGSPLPPREAASLVIAIARGVDEAHRLGLIHRDLKPANVLIGDDGLPKITDFGLVKKMESDSGLTRTDSILGSPSYMAPEQAGGQSYKVGRATDVYSLGAILYELTTGRPPFIGATILDTLQQVKTVDPVPPTRLVPTLPRDVETIILECLEKEPARRYPSAGDLADELRRFLDGEPILARPSHFWERGIKWVRRHPALAGMVATVGVMLIALLTTLAWSYVSVHNALAVAEDRRIAAEIARTKETTARVESDRARVEAERARIEEVAARAESDRARVEAESSRNAALGEAARALLSETRALRISRVPGWRTEALANLSRLATPGVGRPALGRLREEATACLAEFDVHPGPRFTLPGNSDLHGIRSSADGRFLVTVNSPGRVVLVWDTRQPGPLRVIPSAPGSYRVAYGFRPGTAVLAYAASYGRLAYMDLSSDTAAFLPPAIQGPGIPYWLDFDADGRRVAVAWQSPNRTLGQIVVYDVASGRAIRTLDGPFGPAPYQPPLALSPDGRLVAWSGPEFDVRLSEVDGAGPPRILGKHRAHINDLTFDRAGTRLASGSHDRTIAVWPVAAGATEDELVFHGHKTTVNSVAFSPDGNLLASCGTDQTLLLWDTRTGEPRVRINQGISKLSAVAFLPGGERIVACAANAILSFDLTGRDERRELVGHTAVLYGAASVPDKLSLITSGQDHRLLAWDLATGRHQTLLQLTDLILPHRPVISRDGKLAAVGVTDYNQAAPNGRNTYLIDLVNQKTLGTIGGFRANVNALDFGAEGRLLALGDDTGTVILWDLANLNVVGQTKLNRPIHRVAILPGGQLCVAERGGSLVVLNLRGMSTVAHREVPGGMAVAEVGPGRDRVMVGRTDGTLQAFGLPGLEPLGPAVAAHQGRVVALAASADGRLLASAGEDLRLILHNPATLEPVTDLPPSVLPTDILTFAVDSRYLAASSWDRSDAVTLWDLSAIRDGLTDLGLAWPLPPPATIPPAPEADPSVAELLRASSPSVRIELLGAHQLRLLTAADTVDSWRIAALLTQDRLAEAADLGDARLERRGHGHGDWLDTLALRAMAGDRPAYDRQRRRMLDRFGATTDIVLAERTAKACLLLPGDPATIDQAAGLARLATSRLAPNSPLFPYTLLADGLALYRLDRFEEAARQLDRVLAGGDVGSWNLIVPARFLRAMTLARLGRAVESVAELQHAKSLPIPPIPAKTIEGNHDWWICRLLDQEARAVVQLDPLFPADPFQR